MAEEEKKKRKRKKSSAKYKEEIVAALTARGFKVVEAPFHSLTPIPGFSKGGVFVKLRQNFVKKLFRLGKSYKESLKLAKKGPIVRV